MGVGSEQIPRCSSYGQTDTGSAIDIRDLLNSVRDATSRVVSVKLEHWFRSAGENNHAYVSPMPGNNKASCHFLDEVFDALVVALAVHLDAARCVDKEADVNFCFAH